MLTIITFYQIFFYNKDVNFIIFFSKCCNIELVINKFDQAQTISWDFDHDNI